MKSIVRNPISDGEVFMIVSKGNMIKALRELKPNAFKVYVSLMSNQDGYTTEHMQKHVQDETGLSPSRVSEAFVQLREAGYIQVEGETETIYSYAGEPCEYKAERKAGRNNRVPKNGTSTSENRNSDFRNSEQGVPKNGTFTSEIRDTNNTNNTYNTSNNTSIVQEDDDDTDFFFVAPETTEVALQTTSSCSTYHTNNTNNTYNNITVDADANAEKENDKIVVKTTTTASSIGDAASEDAEASSGYDYIKQWESDANKYKDLLRPIQESGALKKFVKGTITPWHYDKSKTEQDYYDKLTALSLWNRVTHNSDFNMENDNNSKHPCFSLKRTYELWNQAEIFTPKD